MEFPGDNDCTIFDWNPRVFCWAEHFQGKFVYHAIGANRVPTTQLIAWLQGEPPPEPEIQVGDKVMLGDHQGNVIYTVLAVDGDVLWCRFNGSHYNFLRKQLCRVG